MRSRIWPFLFGVLSWRAAAYPEYAVRYNMVSCTACHVSPVGGGPRNQNGKLFGAHGYKINPVLVQDYVSADLRALYYYPQRPGTSKGGMGVMQGSVAGHVDLDEEKRIKLVLEHNIAGFAAAQFRDTYALFRLSEKTTVPSWLDTLLVGRFREPFGIITDEHRTYTRVATATEFYTFETGVLLSGTPSYQFHYDVALVSGEDSAGQTVSTGQAERFGGVVNLRWMPGPVMFGASGSYYEHEMRSESTKAVSVYGILSIGRWTNDRIPVFVHVEHTEAWGLDSRLGQGFANDPNYVAALGLSESLGWLTLVEWAITPRFNLIYKYDRLQPNASYVADYYDRHGFGFRWDIGPNVIVQFRSEFANATHPSEADSSAIAAQDATFAILQLSL